MTAEMRHHSAWLLTLLWLAVVAAPARAQSGLYEPFPSGGPGKQARGYLDRLGPSGQRAADSLTERQIAAGAFLDGAAPPGTGAAARRAGEEPHSGPSLPLQLLFILVPVGAVLVVRRR